MYQYSKVISFGLAATAIILGFHLTQPQSEVWILWFLSFFTVIICFGFPLIFTSVGFFVNGTGFQGLLNQPQAYAILLSPFVAWLTLLIIEKRLSRFYFIPLLLIAFISLYATRSRTGALAAVGAISIAIAWSLAFHPVVRSRNGKYFTVPDTRRAPICCSIDCE